MLQSQTPGGRHASSLAPPAGPVAPTRILPKAATKRGSGTLHHTVCSFIPAAPQGQLEFSQGEAVEVFASEDGWAYGADNKGHMGWFPATHLGAPQPALLEEDEDEETNEIILDLHDQERVVGA